jgi:hypothetical protein
MNDIFAFSIDGNIQAADEDDAEDRLLSILEIVGFQGFMTRAEFADDLGRYGVWLDEVVVNRPTGVGTAGFHRQAVVDGPAGPVEVDRALVPILRHLWAHGYTTKMSCQSGRNSGWTWLRFADSEQAEQVAGAIDPARRPAVGPSSLDVTFRKAPTLAARRVFGDRLPRWRPREAPATVKRRPDGAR